MRPHSICCWWGFIRRNSKGRTTTDAAGSATTKLFLIASTDALCSFLLLPEPMCLQVWWHTHGDSALLPSLDDGCYNTTLSLNDMTMGVPQACTIIEGDSR